MSSIVIIMIMVEMETLAAIMITDANRRLAVNYKDQTRDQHLLGNNKVTMRFLTFSAITTE